MPGSERYTVENYMQRVVVTINEQATTRDAIAKFLETRTNSLVVVDAQQRVKGMLSTIDIVKYIVPDYLETDKHVAAFEARNVFVRRVQAIADDPVSQSMTKDVKTIGVKHTLIEAATLLTEHGINQLPVVDDDGKLIGYIGRTNLKQAIHDVFVIKPK